MHALFRCVGSSSYIASRISRWLGDMENFPLYRSCIVLVFHFWLLLLAWSNWRTKGRLIGDLRCHEFHVTSVELFCSHEVLCHGHINPCQSMTAQTGPLKPMPEPVSLTDSISSSLIPHISSVIPGSTAVWWSINANLLEHCLLGVHLNVNRHPFASASFSADESSSGVVVRSMGAYVRLSGHPAGPVLGWVARVEYPVSKHYTCQAVRFGFQESISWLSIVLWMRRRIEVPPT